MNKKSGLAEAMMVRKHIVREVFLILLCIGGIGLATNVYGPFFHPSVSQVLTNFVSRSVIGDSDYSMRSAQKLPVKILMAPSPAPVPARRPQDELDVALAKTANRNKTVIITTLNGAWAKPNTMIDLFLESFYMGEGTRDLLHNLLIVALDRKAYDRCLRIHPHCYFLTTEGVDFSAEKVFMTEDYLKMMWRRLDFMADILERGYSILFSDADIMWMRNPFRRLAEDADIQMTCDKYNGDPFDVRNEANTGFMYIRSNERTIRFYRDWYLSRRFFQGQKEQDVFNILKVTAGFAARGMKFMFLETKYFGGFCERSPDLADAYTMHANCCIGLKAKLIDLGNAMDDWLEYRDPTINSSSPSLGKWRPANACIRSMSSIM